MEVAAGADGSVNSVPPVSAANRRDPPPCLRPIHSTRQKGDRETMPANIGHSLATRGHDDAGTGIKDRERIIAALDELAENPFQAMAHMRD